MNRVLIVASHFPPVAGSSGVLRALKLCRYLPENGWQPTVLTLHPRAYERTDSTQLAEIPADVHVLRTFALDARRHLSIAGRYFRWTALPDRWVSWVPGAVISGLQVIRREKIDAIFSTFPVPSAVLVGWILRRLTGKPWVLDLRDSMTEDDYPRDPVTRRSLRRLEARAVRDSSRILFTAASAIKMYRERYPSLPAEKCALVPNGYDEEDFQDIAMNAARAPSGDRPLRLLHLGLLYPSERDPRPFFRGLARLKSEGRVSTSTLRVDLRASGHESLYVEMLREIGVNDIVGLLPPLPYREALHDAAQADGLLLFQAANCDHQIPAKAYEYLRLRRPILALTSYTGDTAALLQSTGGATIVDLANEEAIYRALPDFLNAVSRGEHVLAIDGTVQKYSRRGQARAVAQYLSDAVEEAARSATQTASVAVK
ncbi:MAG: glycosyltransferase [Candidatus Acidiferrales bacterium]